MKRFVEIFMKNLFFCLDGDIMELLCFEEDVMKRLFIGDYIEVIMEMVVIVDFEVLFKEDDMDEIVIDEMVKLNLIDKCVVWMEVNDSDGDLWVMKKEYEVM